MAVIHITEEEAALRLPDLIAKVREGQTVHIDSASELFTIVPVAEPKRWTLSEAIRRAEAHGSSVLLDDKFGDDMEAIIRQHRNEHLGDSWE